MDDEMSKDKQYATALLNLYTQECNITRTVTFYKKLNQQLRSGKPQTLWKRTEDLMIQSIDLFGEIQFAQLYRGCINDITFRPGQPYNFNQFVSTTLDYDVAWKMAIKDELPTGFYRVVYSIKDAKGLNIEQFSEYADEKEVLLKPTSTFNVLNIVNEGSIKMIDLQYVKRTARSTLAVTEATFCGFNDVTSGADCPTKNLTVISALTLLLLM
jgi:hypothetical protein